MESSGPEGGKVRGPAAMIHERYLQLARDAASSGDRVLSENYLQHADHYFRLWRSIQPATPPQPNMNDRYEGDEAEGDEEAADMEAARDGETAAEGSDQPDVDFPQGQPQQQFDRDGEHRRRRGRRNRYRPNEGEGEPRETRESGEREGGEAREERRERRERPPREQREEAGPEGFSNGPKPAFLRD